MKSEADTMEVERKELNDVEVPDKKLREYSINTLLKLELTENDIEKDFMNIKKNQFNYNTPINSNEQLLNKPSENSSDPVEEAILRSKQEKNKSNYQYMAIRQSYISLKLILHYKDKQNIQHLLEGLESEIKYQKNNIEYLHQYKNLTNLYYKLKYEDCINNLVGYLEDNASPLSFDKNDVVQTIYGPATFLESKDGVSKLQFDEKTILNISNNYIWDLSRKDTKSSSSNSESFTYYSPSPLLPFEEKPKEMPLSEYYEKEKLEEEKNKFELIKEKYTELKQQFNFSEEKEINLINNQSELIEKVNNYMQQLIYEREINRALLLKISRIKQSNSKLGDDETEPVESLDLDIKKSKRMNKRLRQSCIEYSYISVPIEPVLPKRPKRKTTSYLEVDSDSFGEDAGKGGKKKRK